MSCSRQNHNNCVPIEDTSTMYILLCKSDNMPFCTVVNLMNYRNFLVFWSIDIISMVMNSVSMEVKQRSN